MKGKDPKVAYIAMGAMVGSPGGPVTSATGAMIGAVVGGIGGLLSSQ